jgi:hypothetical protein
VQRVVREALVELAEGVVTAAQVAGRVVAVELLLEKACARLENGEAEEEER